MKMQETLHNWGGITCEVVTDEDVKDINLAIKYHDHGDEFLYVRTYSGEEYEYGYYLNRKDCFDDFDRDRNNGESDGIFIRRPILFKEPDECAMLSNTIYWAVHEKHLGIKDHMRFGVLTKDDISADNAKRRFSATVAQIKSMLDKYSNRIYDLKEVKDDLLTFIAVHELDNSYLYEIKDIKWDSKINGFDGIAGKKKADNYLYGDGVIDVLYRGKEFDIKKLTYKHDYYDEWGYCTYELNTKQFA